MSAEDKSAVKFKAQQTAIESAAKQKNWATVENVLRKVSRQFRDAERARIEREFGLPKLTAKDVLRGKLHALACKEQWVHNKVQIRELLATCTPEERAAEEKNLLHTYGWQDDGEEVERELAERERKARNFIATSSDKTFAPRRAIVLDKRLTDLCENDGWQRNAASILEFYVRAELAWPKIREIDAELLVRFRRPVTDQVAWLEARMDDLCAKGDVSHAHTLLSGGDFADIAKETQRIQFKFGWWGTPPRPVPATLRTLCEQRKWTDPKVTSRIESELRLIASPADRAHIETLLYANYGRPLPTMQTRYEAKAPVAAATPAPTLSIKPFVEVLNAKNEIRIDVDYVVSLLMVNATQHVVESDFSNDSGNTREAQRDAKRKRKSARAGAESVDDDDGDMTMRPEVAAVPPRKIVTAPRVTISENQIPHILSPAEFEAKYGRKVDPPSDESRAKARREATAKLVPQRMMDAKLKKLKQQTAIAIQVGQMHPTEDMPDLATLGSNLLGTLLERTPARHYQGSTGPVPLKGFDVSERKTSADQKALVLHSGGGAAASSAAGEYKRPAVPTREFSRFENSPLPHFNAMGRSPRAIKIPGSTVELMERPCFNWSSGTCHADRLPWGEPPGTIKIREYFTPMQEAMALKNKRWPDDVMPCVVCQMATHIVDYLHNASTNAPPPENLEVQLWRVESNVENGFQKKFCLSPEPGKSWGFDSDVPMLLTNQLDLHYNETTGERWIDFSRMGWFSDSPSAGGGGGGRTDDLQQLAASPDFQ